MDRKTVYVAYTNSDLSEGRGHDIPIAVCESPSTAARLARGRYVMGSDGPVRPVSMLLIDGSWFIHWWAVEIIQPSKEDIAIQSIIDARGAAIQKALAAGLTKSDIEALTGAKT